MSASTEYQSYLFNLVSALNTALVLDKKLSENNPFEFALKLDNKTGYLFLDVLSLTGASYYGSESVYENGGLSKKSPSLDLAIVGRPHKVIYTFDNHTTSVKAVRSYHINATNVFKQVNDIINAYATAQGFSGAFFYFNNLGSQSTRDEVFALMAKSMFASNYPSLFLSKLNTGAESYLVPRLNASDEVDGMILEINGLINDHCSNVGIKFIGKHNPKNDIIFARNTGDRIDIAPLGNNSITMPASYYPVVFNNIEKGNALTEIYRDILGDNND